MAPKKIVKKAAAGDAVAVATTGSQNGKLEVLGENGVTSAAPISNESKLPVEVAEEEKPVKAPAKRNVTKKEETKASQDTDTKSGDSSSQVIKKSVPAKEEEPAEKETKKAPKEKAAKKVVVEGERRVLPPRAAKK